MLKVALIDDSLAIQRSLSRLLLAIDQVQIIFTIRAKVTAQNDAGLAEPFAAVLRRLGGDAVLLEQRLVTGKRGERTEQPNRR